MSINLFELIKNHNYDKIKEIINMDEKIDLNLIDSSGVYFIEYIIMYNNIELLALILTKNVKLDILTNDGMSLLFYPIKYNYYEIVRLLLYFNNIKIGISLLDIIDKNHKTPIFYAIEYNNYDICKLILQYNFNYTIKDNDENTCIHYAIIKKDINIIKLLINDKYNYNIRNNMGYTVINLAITYELEEIIEILLENKNIDLSIKDDIYQMTPLLNAFYNNNKNIIKNLNKYKIDYNDQDNKGNSILFYIIYNRNIELYEEYINKVDINLVNIDGENILSFLLKSDINKNDYNKYNIKKLLSQCNLNVQDNNGDIIWHKIIEKDIWIDYIEILSKTKNKIFISNHNNITPYDIFLSKKYDNNIQKKFLYMIYNSYYNYLIMNKKEKYTNKIDLECIKTNYNYEKCMIIIEKNIIKNKISSPIISKGYCIELNVDNVNFITYTGQTIDILFGLIYIKNKYKNICTSLNNNLKFNDKLLKYYENIGIYKNPKFDFLNFEILWIYQHMFIPDSLSSIINNFKKNKKYQYLIIPIGIELSKGSHANMLIYTKKTNELERFEPFGKDFPINFNYIPNLLDKNIFDYFSKFFDNLIYLSPNKYQDKIGPQLLDTNELKKYKNIGDPGGYCAAWSLWYVDIRLQYQNVLRNEIIKKILNKYRYNNISIRSIIRNYIKNITDLRDKYFIKIGFDINNWINFDITNKQYDDLLNLLYSDIDKSKC